GAGSPQARPMERRPDVRNERLVVAHGLARGSRRAEDQQREDARRDRHGNGTQAGPERERQSAREPGRQPRDRHPQERLRPLRREFLERQRPRDLRTMGEHVHVADQVQPPDAADDRQHGEEPAERPARGPECAMTRVTVLAAVALAWVALGVYGTFSYGEAYNTYRGFPPPVDPVGVTPGHLYHEKFYSTALGEPRSFLVYTPPGYLAA